jgi:hypothetical protein
VATATSGRYLGNYAVPTGLWRDLVEARDEAARRANAPVDTEPWLAFLVQTGLDAVREAWKRADDTGRLVVTPDEAAREAAIANLSVMQRARLGL